MYILSKKNRLIYIYTITAIICPRGFSDTAQMVPYNKQMCLQFVSAEKYWDDARDYCWEVS